MDITGVFQFPQNKCICATCGMHCWVEQKAYPTTTSPLLLVASHPTHPTCPHSHCAFEVPVTECKELSSEFFSDQIG